MNTRTRLGGWLGALAGFLLAAGSAQAVENTATNSGFWTNASIWSAGVPTNTHDVVIPAGITVTNTGLATNFINSLTITGTLTHAANGNYPSPGEQHKIVLDVAGNVTIASGGAIDVSSNGYAKAQGPGGSGASLKGPGASHGGEGGLYVQPSPPTYGSITAPTMLGSGATAGAGGGVVILSAGGTIAVSSGAAIRADGASYAAGNQSGASGGSVFLTAAAVAGSGTISAFGGAGYPSSSTSAAGGGGGRIAVVVTNATGFDNLVFEAFGGSGQGVDREHGAAGTVYLKDTSHTAGELRVIAGGLATTAMTLFNAGTNAFHAITLTNRAILAPAGTGVLDLRQTVVEGDSLSRLVFGRDASAILWPNPAVFDMPYSQYGTNVVAITNSVTVADGGVLTHEANGSDLAHRLSLDVGGDLTIQSNGVIEVSFKGYGKALGPGGTNSTRIGASHGGQGGGFETSQAGPTYGSITAPAMLGSGSQAGAGGGAVLLAVGGTLTVAAGGAIRADGTSYAAGNQSGASGGSVYLTAGTLAGSGTISACGGTGTVSGAGSTYSSGGGGGRIAVVLTNASGFDSVSFEAFGGYGAGTGREHGAAGSVYRQTASQGSGKGTVTIDNANQTTTARTQFPAATNAVLDELRYASVIVTNRGALAVTTNDRIQSLTVASTNEPLNLGAADTVLTVKSMTVNGTAYTKGGLYTTNNWNGFALPTGGNVTGAGAILIQSGGSVINFR